MSNVAVIKNRPVYLLLTVETMPRTSDKSQPFRSNRADVQFAPSSEATPSRTSSKARFSTVDHISIDQSLAEENGVCVVVSHLPLRPMT